MPGAFNLTERLDDIEDRIEQTEGRLDRIEATLATILERLEKLDFREAAPKDEELPVHTETIVDPATTGPYVYKALDVAASEIRVLFLETSQDHDSPIKCNLLHVSLDLALETSRNRDPGAVALRKFAALSYTWGENKFDGSIVMDGHLFPVTKNLEAGLRELRKPTTPDFPSETIWWIDAVCINQSDMDERISQVGLMRRIYKTAASVRVWLGAAADDSDSAMDVARQVGSPQKRGPGEPETVYVDIPKAQRLAHWTAIKALFERPWFDRAWIRQEVALAKSITVQCGGATCRLHDLVQLGLAIYYLTNVAEYSPDLGSHGGSGAVGAEWKPAWYGRAKGLSELSIESRMGRAWIPLHSLLVHARGAKATVLHDKVFSVLGLADPEVYGLVPDYRLPFRDVYIRTAISIVSKTNRLDLLSSCQNPERHHGLPSWVPNLIDGWKANPFPPQRMSNATSNRIAAFKFLHDNKTLSVRGWLQDEIESFCDGVVGQEDSNEQLQALYLSWKEAVTKRLAIGSSGYTGTLKHTLCNPSIHSHWISFLSGKMIPGVEVPYVGGKPAPASTKIYDATLNLRLVGKLLMPEEFEETMNPFHNVHNAMRLYGYGRRLGFLKKGFPAFLPGDSQPGDSMAMFDGAPYPYIVRKSGDAYVVVGEAFVYSRIPQLESKYEDIQLI